MRISRLLILIVLTSCQQSRPEKVQTELRDSLVTQYLQLLDSAKWADSMSLQHQLLVAYNRNDTSALQSAVQSLKDNIKKIAKYPSPVSCYTPPPITAFGFDEAYRFQYSAAFCDQSTIITIGNRNDSIYIAGYHYTHDYMTDSCVTVDSLKNILTIDQWTKLQTSMYRADIWGLKESNGIYGFDGSSLSVIGYQKPINAFAGRYNRVRRWAAERSALGESFKLVLDLSGIRVKCFHY